jgi:Family of unknown function (DUF695)
MKTLLLCAFGAAIVLAVAFAITRNKQTKNRDETFSVLQGNVDGRPMFAIIDMGLRNSPDRQALPFFLSLSTPLINPTSDGLPTKSDADDLNTWEDEVESRLGPAAKFAFVGRVTWNGHRELLYYVSAPRPAVEDLQMLADSHSTRPFAFTCGRDEKWTKADFWLNRK